MPVDALIQGLQEPTAASSAVSLPLTGARLQEPTATSSVVTPPFVRVGPQEPTIAPPTVIAPPSERMRPEEPITTLSAVVTPRPEQVYFITRLLTSLLMLPYSHAFFQGLNLSELLAFDPASVGSAILEVDHPQPDSSSVVNQLIHVKDFLSAPIDTLVQDSSAVRHILEEINSQLPIALQIKLWPTGHLPCFRARIEQARHRIEIRRSQAPLKANIAERCWSLNEKKVILDAKADTSVHSQQLHLLQKELEDLKARVRATEQRIQEEKDLIANSKQEVEALTAQLKVDLAELSTLSKQVVPGVDGEDEAMIAEADRVCLEAIAVIDTFLQQVYF
jgi:hypothetical protein